MRAVRVWIVPFLLALAFAAAEGTLAVAAAPPAPADGVAVHASGAADSSPIRAVCTVCRGVCPCATVCSGALILPVRTDMVAPHPPVAAPPADCTTRALRRPRAHPARGPPPSSLRI